MVYIIRTKYRQKKFESLSVHKKSSLKALDCQSITRRHPQLHQATRNPNNINLLSRISKPITHLQKRLSSPPNLLTSLPIHILLAHMFSPGFNDLFLDQITLIKRHEDFGS